MTHLDRRTTLNQLMYSRQQFVVVESPKLVYTNNLECRADKEPTTRVRRLSWTEGFFTFVWLYTTECLVLLLPIPLATNGAVAEKGTDEGSDGAKTCAVGHWADTFHDSGMKVATFITLNLSLASCPASSSSSTRSNHNLFRIRLQLLKQSIRQC